MNLLPDRRGSVHYGALVLCLLVAVFGLAMAISILMSGGETFWPTGPKHIPDPSTAEVLSTPEPFVKLIQHAHHTQKSGLQALASVCTASFRMLLFVSALALVAALTTPGKPRFVRFPDSFPDLRRTAWLDCGLAAAASLLFGGGHLLAWALIPDLSHRPVLPPDGQAVHRLLAAEASKMALTMRSVLLVGGLAALVFLAVLYRTGRALWKGPRDERRRRQAEANARTVHLF